ncbi:MAG: hypothetical protein ABEI53_00175 [Candidatus Magasanikbacteria bacterium]
MSEEKIFIKAEEDVEEVADHIKNSSADKIILNIPENSKISSSLDNFHRLKRESAIEDKKLVIESVDSKVEEMANLSNVDCVNPIFGKQEKIFADIVPRGGSSETPYDDPKEESNDFETSEEDFLKKKNEEKNEGNGFFGSGLKLPSPQMGKKKKLTAFISLILLTGLGYYLATSILPTASIAVALESKSKTFKERVVVSSNFSSSSVSKSNIKIPGEIITAQKNIRKDFSSSEVVEKKVTKRARGKIKVFNNYGPTSITLVKNTRFKSPDGLVYKSTSKVVVPPAKKRGGEIIPSSVEVTVRAARAGRKYNTEKISNEKWTIPGFKESNLEEMYRGFYARPVSLMKGGLVGTRVAPSKKKLREARKEVRKELLSALRGQIKVLHSSDLKILPRGGQFLVEETNVKKKKKGEGFTVFMSGTLKKIGFNEEQLKKVLRDKLISTSYPVRIVNSKFKYKNINSNWSKSQMEFTIEGRLETKPRINKSKIKAQVLGKTENLMKPVIFDIHGLKEAKVSLWPFWVKEVPSDPSKVRIKLN